jgi:hypothetical protein
MAQPQQHRGENVVARKKNSRESGFKKAKTLPATPSCSER